MGKKNTPASYIQAALNKKRKKKSLGGTLDLGVGLFNMIKDMNKPTEQFNSQVNELNYNSNPYLEEGGKLGHKQYNAPSHEQGGQAVDNQGNIDPNGSTEIEGTENKYTYSQVDSGKSYVFSDKNGTSDMLRSVLDKYKKKNTNEQFDTRAAMEMEIKNVQNINERINEVSGTVQNELQARYGKKMPTGGPLDPLSSIRPGLAKLPHSNTVPQQGLLSNTGNQPLPALGNSATNPTQGLVPDGFLPTLYKPLGQVTSQSANGPLDTDPLSLKGNPFANDGEPESRKIDYGNILRSTGLIGSAIDAFGKTDKEEVVTPDYSESDARYNKMNANLTQAKQDALGASNMASGLNRNAASSYSQFRARELSNIGNLRDSLGQIGATEQQLRNNILAQQGQYETGKAVRDASIKDDVQQRNLANKAKSQDLKKLLFSDIVHEGDRLSTIKNNKEVNQAKIKEGMEMLKTIAPDFDVNEDFIKNMIKVSQGKLDVNKLNPQEMLIFNSLQ